ncbi:Uncharacterized protein PBTT_02412 [Plasmodiophora brassicae]
MSSGASAAAADAVVARAAGKPERDEVVDTGVGISSSVAGQQDPTLTQVAHDAGVAEPGSGERDDAVLDEVDRDVGFELAGLKPNSTKSQTVSPAPAITISTSEEVDLCDAGGAFDADREITSVREIDVAADDIKTVRSDLASGDPADQSDTLKDEARTDEALPSNAPSKDAAVPVEDSVLSQVGHDVGFALQGTEPGSTGARDEVVLEEAGRDVGFTLADQEATSPTSETVVSRPAISTSEDVDECDAEAVFGVEDVAPAIAAAADEDIKEGDAKRASVEQQQNLTDSGDVPAVEGDNDTKDPHDENHDAVKLQDEVDEGSFREHAMAGGPSAEAKTEGEAMQSLGSSATSPDTIEVRDDIGKDNESDLSGVPAVETVVDVAVSKPEGKIETSAVLEPALIDVPVPEAETEGEGLRSVKTLAENVNIDGTKIEDKVEQDVGEAPANDDIVKQMSDVHAEIAEGDTMLNPVETSMRRVTLPDVLAVEADIKKGVDLKHVEPGPRIAMTDVLALEAEIKKGVELNHVEPAPRLSVIDVLTLNAEIEKGVDLAHVDQQSRVELTDVLALQADIKKGVELKPVADVDTVLSADSKDDVIVQDAGNVLSAIELDINVETTVVETLENAVKDDVAHGAQEVAETIVITEADVQVTAIIESSLGNMDVDNEAALNDLDNIVGSVLIPQLDANAILEVVEEPVPGEIDVRPFESDVAQEASLGDHRGSPLEGIEPRANEDQRSPEREAVAHRGPFWWLSSCTLL